MLKVTYNLTIGTWSVNSDDNLKTEFIELETNLSLTSPQGYCRISVYSPPAGQPGLLEGVVTEAAGALGLGEAGGESLAVQIRGEEIKAGDLIAIELTVGDVSETVMTAEVESINSSFGQTKITGRTGMQKLANARLNQVYENQTLSQIVNDLAGQAGVSVGEIETGNTYPCYVVHEAKSLLAHIRELAMRDGLDIYFFKKTCNHLDYLW